MVQFQNSFVQDLSKPIKKRYGGSIFFYGDKAATVISVRLTNNGSDATISGTVTCDVMRFDGVTVHVDTGGSITGSTVSVTLTEQCLAVVGPITLTVTVTDSDVRTTVLQVVYTVESTSTSVVVDPGIDIEGALKDAVIADLGGDPIAVAHGGTGQTSLQATRNAMGLGNTTGALPIANGGTGAESANSALSNLTSAMPYNGNWKDAPLGMSIYYYDTNSASSYDVPSGSSFVVVIRHQYSNLIAVCFKYTGSPKLISWNRKNGSTWTGWQSIVEESKTFTLSTTNYISTFTGACRTWMGNMHMITIGSLITAANTPSWTTIATIPSGHRPSDSIYGVLRSDSSNSTCGIYINTSGQIQLFGHSSGTSYGGTVTYIS